MEAEVKKAGRDLLNRLKQLIVPRMRPGQFSLRLSFSDFREY